MKTPEANAYDVFTIPTEVWLMIIKLLGKSECKQLRLSCSRFCILTSPILFHTIYFDIGAHGCESLFAISSHTELSQYVKTLVLRIQQGFGVFDDAEAWAQSTCQPGDPGHNFAPADLVEYNDDENLLPYSEWLDLSKTQKEELYDQYKEDHEKAKQQIRDITNRLQFRASGVPGLLVHPERASLTKEKDDPVEQLCQALRKLSNLTAVDHEPSFLFDERWKSRWRNIRFHPWSLVDNNIDEDKDTEALQLSVVLQLLAWTRRGLPRRPLIRSLSIYVGGPAFWGPQRLQHLWDGYGHEITRTSRTIHENDAAAADREAYSDYGDLEETKLYFGELCLMRETFIDLTRLDCSISEDTEEDGSLGIAAKWLFGFLWQTKKLERLRLVFGRLVDGILIPGDNDNTYVQDSAMLLGQLAKHTPWTRLQRIELEIATTRATLVEFLLAHKNTLRSLSLERVTLVRLEQNSLGAWEEDSLGTWELTLGDIGKNLSLTTLDLSTLHDFASSVGGGGAQQRTLFDSGADLWRGETAQYHDYYHSTIDQILRGHHIVSLDPERLGGDISRN
ncbi:hypothetical protein DM02DRAFT_577639 [Periconia macrospinosa]|uniref:F-box domain-containing protein n=1 Tax=Periconia macrospinosa TaxID=97972 RepID=A0A2V1CYC8_9PLEO|nr:hypothetical protein DM02DRAFT_577639 [Periconia macrospinosa]